MAFISSVKFLSMFFDNSCYESISQEVMTVKGSDTNAITLSNGVGYVMQQDQFLVKENVDITINRNFIIGFWLNSVNPGMAVDPITGQNVSVEMPVLDLIYDGYFSNRLVSIYENTEEDSQNYMTVSISNGDYKASTSLYDIGVWHYYWIVYNGFSNNVDIYMDGEEVVLQNTSGSVPNNLSSDLVDVYINKNVVSYDYNKAANFGYIDNVIIFNNNFHSDIPLQTIINKGVYYAIDTDYMEVTERNQCLAFEDPYRITVNAMVDDMSYVYLARSDGNILQGSPLFWETRKNLTFTNELELMNETEVVPGNKAQITSDGFLSINNSIIEI